MRFCSTDWSKSDYRDAWLLASLLIRKIDTLPKMSTDHTHAKTFSKLKKLLYLWDDVTREMQRHKNQLHHLLYQHDTEYKKKYFDLGTLKVLNQLVKSFARREGILSQHINWKAQRVRRLREQKQQLRKTVQEELDDLPWELETMPGVGPTTALAILATTHGGQKFQNIDQFKRYVGCIPRPFESGTSEGQRTKASSTGID